MGPDTTGTPYFITCVLPADEDTLRLALVAAMEPIKKDLRFISVSRIEGLHQKWGYSPAAYRR